MKAFCAAAIAIILLGGCATTDQKANRLLIKNYEADHDAKLLLYIDSQTGSYFSQPRVSLSFLCPFMQGLNRSESFETPLPYAVEIDLKGVIEEYRKLKPEQRALTSIIFSLLAQDNANGFLIARALFDGKEIASDSTSVVYGAVSISGSVPLEEYLLEHSGKS